MFSGSSDLTQRMIKYAELDELVAFVDLSEGTGRKGLLFGTELLRSLGCGGTGNRDYYYKVGNCYLRFSEGDIMSKFDPRKLNYVLDKVHKITEGKY